jgi:DNA-binding CsgD family transcriptional regulator
MVDRVSAAGFIGRAHELAELEASLADARAGNPRLVFLTGESGVGKSRLLDEFRARAKALGARELGGECIELGEDELPYAPLVGSVRPLARDADPVLDELPAALTAELARLAPELGSPAPERLEDREGESQRRLFDALLALLERLGKDEGVVFWLEDIHWADRSTRSFLAFLSSSLRDERVLVLSSYRSDELHRRHPLRPLLNELERGPCARRVELRPFDRGELAAQLADILGGAPEDEVIERLYSRSEGNPLFTEELLAAGLDGRGSLPPTLREALLTRLERLSEPTRRALAVLAVAGRADDATLAAAGEFDASELREALREAVASHLVRPDRDGRFGFRHALFREVVYDDLLPGERSDLHLALARTLEARAERDDGAWLRTAIAHHYHQAGEQREALRAAVVAAERAERVHAPGEAASLLERALALWPRIEGPEKVAGCDLTALLARAGRMQYRSGNDERALTLLEDAADRVEADAEPLRLARLLGDLSNLRWSFGQPERSRELLDRALELVPDEPTEEAARLLAHQVRFKLLQGRFGEIEPIAKRAIEMCDALGLEIVKAGVLNRWGPALFPLGESARGEELMREGLELAKRVGGPDDLSIGYVNYADVLHIYGRSEEARTLLEEGMSAVSTADRSRLWLVLLRSEIDFELGDWDAAAEVPSTRALVRGNTLANSRIRGAELALGRGDLETARPLVEEAWEILSESVEPQFLAAAAALLAELAIRERRIDAARGVVAEALDRIQYCTEDAARVARVAATGVQVEAAAAESARDLGDAAAERDAVERARYLFAQAEACAGDHQGPIQDARLITARADLARAEGSAESAELAAAAATAWHELGRPYHEACMLRDEAEARVAAGERDIAADAAGRALEIARRLGSQWLRSELESLAARARLNIAQAAEPAAEPAPDSGDANPFGLTDREQQVLTLVAAGATNREIAAELFMAEKTASVHVSRILAKLSVSSRTEAAAVAIRQGLVEVAEPTTGAQ